MCRTPEEAAWTVLAMTAEQRQMRTLVKAIELASRTHDCVYVDVVSDAAMNVKRVTAKIEFAVSKEVWRHLVQEAEREPTLVD